MMRTVSSPAMVPATSGNLAASAAAARGWAPLGGVLRTSRFSAGRISRRNSERARARGGKGAASSGRAAAGLVALGSFDGLHLLQGAGKGGLGDAEALLGQAAAKLFLIGDALGGNKPEDLTVAECFAGAHGCRNIHRPVFLYRVRSPLVKSFFEMQERIANRRVSKWPMQDSHRFRDGHWIFWPR